jgi:biotin-(acetyl-CoA carboxylase) ligase
VCVSSDPPVYRTIGGADRRLDLPPGYTAVPLREKDDAFAHAIAIAAEDGAGTLVWVPRFDTIEFALVLEPGDALVTARRVLYPIMTAVGDAIAAYCPPERPVTFAWPDTVMLDRGIVGGVRLAWPDAAAEDAVPDWLVAGVVLRTLVAARKTVVDFLAQGRIPLAVQLDDPTVDGATLQGDDFEMMPAERLIGSFCRHFLVQLDTWQEGGFTPVAQTYLARLPEVSGVRRGIDANGDLLTRSLAAPEPAREPLLAALATPQWRDPATGEPWL